TARVQDALADGAVLHLFGGFASDDLLPLAGGDALPVGPVRSGARSVRVALPGGRAAVVTGSRGGRAEDMRSAAGLASPEAGLALDRLVSHIVSLPALPGVVDEILRTGTVGGSPPLRVVVDLGLDGLVVRRTAGRRDDSDGADG
ncbi:MAG: hypothetical protein QG622_3756, partial [Actinomycetota bacterium]|nr:hypothetical protein [Actinomycetota bacterium]